MMEPHTVSKLLKIGALASKAGLSRDTIRFYEREALLPKPPRTPAGYRLYSAEALARLHFIKHARALGLSLTEIRHLLGGYQDAEECRQVKYLLEQKLSALDQQMRSLQALRETLQRHLEACQEVLRDSEVNAPCPVLAILTDQGGQPS
jgi:DNA-binding transcriptional MerR regulator